jgi:hypothetical protein
MGKMEAVYAFWQLENTKAPSFYFFCWDMSYGRAFVASKHYDKQSVGSGQGMCRADGI